MILFFQMPSVAAIHKEVSIFRKINIGNKSSLSTLLIHSSNLAEDGYPSLFSMSEQHETPLYSAATQKR